MRTLNIRGAFLFAVLFLGMSCMGKLCFPSDINVYFSKESGFYDETVVLELICAMPGAEIYYTLDGSIPTEQSYYYDGPITLENVEGEPNWLSAFTGISDEDFVPEENMMKANVVRAAAFWKEKRISNVCSGTYFVGIDKKEEYGNIPIVSLILEEEDLFDYEKGIYTLGITYDDWYDRLDDDHYNWWDIEGNFSNKGREWERPVYVEYLDVDGRVGFAQNMGVRIKGGSSRIFNHKSLRLIAREEYGAKKICYPMFENDGQLDSQTYRQLVLRTGSSDRAIHIRNPLIHSMAKNLRMATQRMAPCIVFINGEYWGLYTLTEEYDAQYCEENYGMKKENVVIIKLGELEEGVEEDMLLYEEMVDFIINQSMSVPTNYERASQLLDMGSFAEYVALQIYADNVDCFLAWDNNWQMWRARTLDSSNFYGDGRWRMMLFDTDLVADPDGVDWREKSDNLIDALFDPVDERWASKLLLLLRSLYQNEEFQQEMVNAMCDIRNVHFAPEPLYATFCMLQEAYEPHLVANLRRFGPQYMLDWGAQQYCEQELKELLSFFEERYEVFPQLMQEALDLQPPAECTISIDGDGSVMVNHAVPDWSYDYTGHYFPDYPITLTAQENGDGRFVRWEYEGCTLSDPDSPVTEVSFAGDFSICAVFE